MSRLAIQITPMGEVPVRVDDKGNVLEELPLPKGELKELPQKFRDKHRDALLVIGSGIDLIVKRRRAIPMLREEAINFGITKAVLNDLEQMGFIKNRITPLIKKTTGKSQGARAVIVPTPLYHAYLAQLQAKELKAVPDATN